MTFWDGERWLVDESVAPRQGSSGRLTDVVATGSMIVVLIVGILLPGLVRAAGPALSVSPDSGAPGNIVAVLGSGFGKRESIQLAWDGDPAGMPAVIANAKGSFKARITVPNASPGQHTIDAAAVAGPSKAAATASEATAQTVFTVSGAEPAPTPAPTTTPVPDPTPAPTPAPTPEATPEATAQPSATPEPSPAPTTTAPATMPPSPNPSVEPTPAGTSTLAPTSTVSGIAYRDFDRDGFRDPGDTALAGQSIVLRTTGGAVLGAATTDDLGSYSFSGVADGIYEVAFADGAWRALRSAWVPTSTGSYYPRALVSVDGSARQDFGWRPIVRSDDVRAPIDVHVGATGLRVETFNDVIPARVIHDELMRGLVGPESIHVTIRFDYSANSSTVAAWQGTAGSYHSFSAVCYGTYAFWLDGGDQILSHEYGHAWSYYYDVIVQQDSEFTRYLAARGLSRDPRVGSSYRWMPAEMIAEDYRQLFGSPNAQEAWQTNHEIPTADSVLGLRDFFLTTFMAPPAD
jgi:hypothetical protein